MLILIAVHCAAIADTRPDRFHNPLHVYVYGARFNWGVAGTLLEDIGLQTDQMLIKMDSSDDFVQMYRKGWNLMGVSTQDVYSTSPCCYY